MVQFETRGKLDNISSKKCIVYGFVSENKVFGDFLFIEQNDHVQHQKEKFPVLFTIKMGQL
jgi:hypothetical protein